MNRPRTKHITSRADLRAGCAMSRQEFRNLRPGGGAVM